MTFSKPLRMVAAAAILLVSHRPSHACTRILWNDNSLAVVVGRTMDWPESTWPVLTVLPRGMERDGGTLLGQTVVADNPARWTSRYGSLVTTTYGAGAADGVNEKGLAFHLLYLNATDYGPRDESKAGVHAGLWGQYLVDHAATVAEALELLTSIQPVHVSVQGHAANLHLAIEDASGDSAIVEYIGGKLVIHHGRQYRIMTNDPRYEDQLAHLATFDFSNATRQTPLPGNVDPRDRFVRSAYFLSMLPDPATEREAIAGILAIARNASVPFGAPNNLPGSLYNTEFRTAINLTHPRYYFELSTSPHLIWVDLARLNFAAGAEVMTLNPDNVNLAGDVSDRFQPAPAPF